MKIHAVNNPNGGNRWCGPAAVSAVTGATTDEAAFVLRQVSGRGAIKGTSDREVLLALAHYGIASSPVRRYPADLRPTLAGWLRADKEKRTPGRVFLVAAGGHWQVISGRRYVCSVTGGIVSIKDKRVRRRCRVESVYELQQTKRVGLSDEMKTRRLGDEEQKRRARRAISAANKARRLAKQIGLEVEYDRETKKYWVWPGSSWCDDPREDEHFAYDGGELLELVEWYRDNQEGYRA